MPVYFQVSPILFPQNSCTYETRHFLVLQYISFIISPPQKTSKTDCVTCCPYMPAPRELQCCWKEERAMSKRNVRSNCMYCLGHIVLTIKYVSLFNSFTHLSFARRRWPVWDIAVETAGFRCWGILGSYISKSTDCFHRRLYSVLFGQQEQQQHRHQCQYRYCDITQLFLDDKPSLTFWNFQEQRQLITVFPLTSSGLTLSLCVVKVFTLWFWL